MTLIEVVMAAGLLMVLLSGLFASLATARRVEVLTRERQAASEAASRVLDRLTADTQFGDLVRGTEVPVYAFDVPYGPTSLPAAQAAYWPRNLDDPDTAADESAFAGHVSVTDLAIDGDYDGDGVADAVDVRVTVAWRSVDGSNQRVDLIVRRGP